MESIKTCHVCFVSFDTKKRAPRFLPCGHTICSTCLPNILFNPLLRKCPFDNHPFPSSQNSLASFPINFLAMDMLEQRNDNLCKIHLGEKLKYICLTENKKICSECAKQEGHKEHKIKKIQTLKAEGAKVKGELQQSLLKIREHELQEQEDCEEIRKVFIKTIDEQFQEIQEILVEKQFELVQQANNLFMFNNDRDSKKLSKLKQEMNQTIKNITQISDEDGGDMVLLDNALDNSKMQPELLKERSSRVQNKLLEIENTLTSSLNNSKTGINSLELSKQKLIEEICSGDQEEQQKLSKTLESIKPKSKSIKPKSKRIKFKSYFDVTNHENYLKISATSSELKEIKIDLEDFKAQQSIWLDLKRYDTFSKEPKKNLLSFLLNKLDKLSCFDVSFAGSVLKNDALLWVANIICNHYSRLKHLHLDFRTCKMNDKFMEVLCDNVLSKIPNLETIGLYFRECRVRNQDLKILADCLASFQKNLSTLKIRLINTTGGVNDSGLCELLQMLPSRKKLEILSLDLQGYLNITNKSLEIFGEVLPNLKGLKDLTFSTESDKLKEKGIWSVLKNLKKLTKLNLNFSEISISDELIKRFIEEVLSKMKKLETFNFITEKREINYAALKKMLELFALSNPIQAQI